MTYTMSVQSAQFVLMYLLIPLWITAGFVDWIFHRKTDIEHTSGPKESLIHLLMFAEVGFPLLAALLLDINALVIGLMIAAFFVHEATALWDVRYAVSKRWVGPLEQHAHSFLEMLPLMAIGLISLVHEPQFLALLGMGSEAPRFTLELKPDPLPPSYIAGFLIAATAFTVLPYLNELWRGLRAAGHIGERR
jgi:hypothetical protein